MVELTEVLLAFFRMPCIAIQGEPWFLRKIYGFPQDTVYFGVPFANFAGWAVVGFFALLGYRWLERGSYASDPNPRLVTLFDMKTLKGKQNAGL